MSEIKVKRAQVKELQELGVTTWPVWERDPSTFDYQYDEKETCFLLEGEAIIKTEDGKTVRIAVGDLVEFPKGLKCTWKISRRVTKHYKLGD